MFAVFSVYGLVAVVDLSARPEFDRGRWATKVPVRYLTGIATGKKKVPFPAKLAKVAV